MQEASKRRCNKIKLLSLSFVSKLISQKILIKHLKRDNQLQLFRRLERSSEKLINSKCALEFIQLCQRFDLTPTFAKVTNTKWKKWRQSAKSYEQNVIAEELSEKKKQISLQKEEVNKIYNEIRKNCDTLRYICILKTVVNNKIIKGWLSRVFILETKFNIKFQYYLHKIPICTLCLFEDKKLFDLALYHDINILIKKLCINLYYVSYKFVNTAC